MIAVRAFPVHDLVHQNRFGEAEDFAEKRVHFGISAPGPRRGEHLAKFILYADRS